MQNVRGATRLMRVLALGVPFVVAGCNMDGLFGSDRSRVRVVLSGDDGSASASLATASASASRDDDKKGDDRNEPSRLSSWFKSAQVTLSSVMFRSIHGELVDADIDMPVNVDVVK